MTTLGAPADAVLAELAQQLCRAEADRVGIAPLTDQVGISTEDGYRIQAINTARRVQAGERIVGRKVGLTSVAMQQQLGVDEPDFGIVFESMLIEDGGVLYADQLVAPRVEAEIAFRLGADLAGADVTDEQARRAIADVLIALEVIDSRIADWKIQLPDTIADNASSARMVVGPILPATPELVDGLPRTQVTLTEDGVVTASGLGAAVLGHPVKAVSWLARRLSEVGEGLRAGDLVLAGAVHASVALTKGTEVAASAAGLGQVTLRVE
jgi:2-keto-4-pentenoate hydratase